MSEISVILPVRNGGETLGACLGSLGAQTLRDYDLVAIDDGSTDDTPALLARSAARDARLRVLRMPARGLVQALNMGLAAAAGRFIARMDADDIAHPERLARQLARLRADDGVDVLASRVSLLSSTPEPNSGMRRYVEWTNGLLDHASISRGLYVDAPLVHPSVMLRRTVLEALGGYREFDGPEDCDLWLRAHEHGFRFSKLPEFLLHWRDTPDRLTRTDARDRAERFQALKIEALGRGPLVGKRAVVVWGAGPIGKSWARALQASGYRVQAFVEVNPRRVGQSILGVPVVPVPAAGLRGPLHIAAVGQPGARERILLEMSRLGLVEGLDFVAVA
jgi:glycosyltransferase involved in cell wall biosynthesis